MTSMRDRFGEVVTALLRDDPDLAVVLADISVDRFQDAAKEHPDRVLNVGIREQTMIGVGAGLALEGFRPIAHSYAPFLVERAFEQIKISLCHQGLGALLVSVGASYDWAAGGRTHHAPGDVALLSTLPGVRIHVPGHADEVEDLLRRETKQEDVVYIRLSEASNRRPVRAPDDTLQFVLRSPQATATVVAVGPMLDPVLDAAGELPVDVLYGRTVRPFDGATLRSQVGHRFRELGTAAATVILVEPYLEGTSAGEVSTALADIPHRLLSLGVPKTELHRYGTADEHSEAYGLDAAGVRARFADFLPTESGATV